jgi:putative oligomerization/nucleic acid binding protein
MDRSRGVGYAQDAQARVRLGAMLEYDDGTVGYVPAGRSAQQFRVPIADVTGFSVTKDRRVLERMFNVMGDGTLLGSASVNHKESEKIEKWFRSHPRFGGNGRGAGAPTHPAHGSSVADELRKLAELHKQGVLTDEEFDAQKARLLAS